MEVYARVIVIVPTVWTLCWTARRFEINSRKYMQLCAQGRKSNTEYAGMGEAQASADRTIKIHVNILCVNS